MDKPISKQIQVCIEKALDLGKKSFIIFPFGDTGVKALGILREVYNISNELIIDNHLCKYNDQIKPLKKLEEIDTSESAVLFMYTNIKKYDELKDMLIQYVSSSEIYELECMRKDFPYDESVNFITKIGKYSYGSICRNHAHIESIGAFCSFGPGVDIAANHETNFLTTHPMIYAGQNLSDIDIDYKLYKEHPWYFDGVQPKKVCTKLHRITIGNDVWLGKDVSITNQSNIGNGVIAGAGAVITKDVPDYAIVVGCPARILRFRYSPEQIRALNLIQWWNWTDEEIRERYNDFYLPIEEFIKNYLKG